MISTALIRVALKILESAEWGWRNLGAGLFIKRNNSATKCAAIVAHDRIICGDILTRGTPSFYGQKQ